MAHLHVPSRNSVSLHFGPKPSSRRRYHFYSFKYICVCDTNNVNMFLHVFMCVMTTQDDDDFFSGCINRLLDGVCVWQGKAYYPNGIMRMLRYAAM